MEQKESPVLKEAKLAKEESLLRKVPTTVRKDSEKSMKSDGPEMGGSRPSIVTIKDSDSRELSGQTMSPKVPRKIINNWRQACDKTKDKTKELLKKWRTLPEPGQLENDLPAPVEESNTGSSSGWSEHVWTAWVKRTPDGEEPSGGRKHTIDLNEFQRKKFAHFFIFFLDLDRDDVISLADFEAFSERLRHFSDWSKSSTEYSRLKEVQRGFIESFLLPEELENTIHSYEMLEKKLNKEQLSLDEWLEKWNQILEKSRNYQELPLWLQYFPKLLFHVINRSDTGIITKDELSAFYTSIVGLTATQIEGFLGNAYKALTSNEEQPLTYATFRLCFANFLLARYPNGPGQYLFGPITGVTTTCFPIDYKAMCYAPEDLEQYSPIVKTNRRSVIV
ncbi:UNVERIFIED_CONTAM: hypothetical protein PYX00_007799 [Menopon gallinae]|uniref:Uncharacterized protein n=1 Tax=Menopon gallinae TaxID=328185 RepID=A0AAW2HLC1_9NEOP